MTKSTEWVAVLHGQTGTVKIAYRNPLMLARGLEGQTSEGWTVARIYERECETYDAVCSTCNGMGRIHGIGAAEECPDCSPPASRCNKYMGDRDATTPNLRCIREKGHPGGCDSESDAPDGT